MTGKLSGCFFWLIIIIIYSKKPVLFGIKSVLILKKELDSEFVCNKKILKTKIKLYCDETTDFYDIEISKEDSNHTYLAIIGLDSALEKDKIYYLQVNTECEYIPKIVIRHINKVLSNFSYSDEFDEE